MDAKEWSEFQANEYARGGSEHCTSRSLDTDRFQFARRILADERPPPALVMDVGCGDGSFSRELAKKGYGVIALDLPEAVERIVLGEREWRGLPEPPPKPFHIVFDGYDLGYLRPVHGLPSGWPGVRPVVDAVVALEIFEHVVYDFDLARWILANLRSGGTLVASVPIGDNNCLPGDHHLRYYTERSIKKLLWVAGFNDIGRISTVQGPSSLLVKAVKP